MERTTFKKRCLSLAVLIIVISSYVALSQGQTVQITIPDTIAETGSVITIPVRCSDVTGKWIYSYGFKLSYDNSVIQATGVTVLQTITEAWGTPTNNITDGEITIAIAGSSPLSGSGVLIFFSFSVVGDSGFSSTLNISEMMFNEGEPSVNTKDGSCTIYKIWSGVHSIELHPTRFRLFPAFPNPFNPSTTIEFDIAKMNHVNIKIFDVMARFVCELLNETLDGGHHSIKWHGMNLSGMEAGSGVYFVQIFFNQRKLTQKILKLN